MLYLPVLNINSSGNRAAVFNSVFLKAKEIRIAFPLSWKKALFHYGSVQWNAFEALIGTVCGVTFFNAV